MLFFKSLIFPTIFLPLVEGEESIEHCELGLLFSEMVRIITSEIVSQKLIY